MIAIVETYYRLSRKLDAEAYLLLLEKAVYSKTKAKELKNQFEFLGQMWFRIKDRIKEEQLKNVPQVKSTLLQKDLFQNEIKRKQMAPDAKGVDSNPKKPDERSRDIDVLVKLLPFYDTDLTIRNDQSPDAKHMR